MTAFEPGDVLRVWLERPGPGNIKPKDPCWTVAVEGVLVSGPDQIGLLAVLFTIDDENDLEDWRRLMPDAPEDELYVGWEWINYEVDPSITAVERTSRRSALPVWRTESARDTQPKGWTTDPQILRTAVRADGDQVLAALDEMIATLEHDPRLEGTRERVEDFNEHLERMKAAREEFLQALKEVKD